MRIKNLFLLMAAVLLMLCLVACGKKDNELEEPTTEITTETIADDESEVEGKIIVWVKSDKLVNTKFSEYKKEFEASHPNTEIEYKVIENFEITGYRDIIDGTDADVVMIPNRMTTEEIKEYFVPFGTTESLASKYKEKYIRPLDCDGVIYGIPEYIKPHGIIYNKRVLEYAGILELPKSPEEFFDMLNQVKNYDNEIIPFYVKEASLEDWQYHAWGSVTGDPDYHYNGMVMETNPFAEDSPNYIVHKLLYDLVDNGYTQDREIDSVRARSMLNIGKIACMLADFDEISKVQEAGTNPDDIGYMPFPYNIDDKQYATTTYGYCYGIPKASSNRVTAEAFVKYMIKSSGYAASEGALTIKKKTSKPKLLDDFGGVEFLVDNPPMEDKIGKYKLLCEKSGVLLDDESTKAEVIAVARKGKSQDLSEDEEEKSKGKSKEKTEEIKEDLPKDFDSLMKNWYEKWKTAK